MPGDDGFVTINPELRIPRSELSFRATRAGGPGGQHVNRVATRVELRWNVRESPTLTDDQRALLLARLTRRLDTQGRLRIVCDVHRSQHRNREEAITRFTRVLATAMRVQRPRTPTRPTRASVEERLAGKRRRADTKRRRRPPGEND